MNEQDFEKFLSLIKEVTQKEIILVEAKTSIDVDGLVTKISSRTLGLKFLKNKFGIEKSEVDGLVKKHLDYAFNNFNTEFHELIERKCKEVIKNGK